MYIHSKRWSILVFSNQIKLSTLSRRGHRVEGREEIKSAWAALPTIFNEIKSNALQFRGRRKIKWIFLADKLDFYDALLSEELLLTTSKKIIKFNIFLSGIDIYREIKEIELSFREGLIGEFIWKEN